MSDEGVSVGGAAFEPDAVHAKYLAERDKRLVPGRADIRDLTTDEHFSRYRADPFTPLVERPPMTDDVDVVVVGGGIAGVLAATQLRKAGVERIRILDQAGGIMEHLFEQIREINARGLSILMVEQNARQALRIAHYAYLLEVGRLASEGPAAALMASDEVQRVYLGL